MESMSYEMLTKGVSIFIGDSISSKYMEDWVKEIAQNSGAEVDWGWSCGRAVVSTLGNPIEVKEVLDTLLPIYYILRNKSLVESGLGNYVNRDYPNELS